MNAKTRNFIVFSAAGALLLASAFLALRLGSVPLSSAEFWGGMLQKEGYETYTAIFYSSRLPRVLGAILAGVAFSQAGTLLQRVTDNPLASPSILGINAGGGVCGPSAACMLSPRLCLSPFGGVSGGAACDRSHIGRGALGGDEPRRHRACGRRPSPPSFRRASPSFPSSTPTRSPLTSIFR